jgi:hypothetical protein
MPKNNFASILSILFNIFMIFSQLTKEKSIESEKAFFTDDDDDESFNNISLIYPLSLKSLLLVTHRHTHM